MQIGDSFRWRGPNLLSVFAVATPKSCPRADVLLESFGLEIVETNHLRVGVYGISEFRVEKRRAVPNEDTVTTKQLGVFVGSLDTPRGVS